MLGSIICGLWLDHTKTYKYVSGASACMWLICLHSPTAPRLHDLNPCVHVLPLSMQRMNELKFWPAVASGIHRLQTLDYWVLQAPSNPRSVLMLYPELPLNCFQWEGQVYNGLHANFKLDVFAIDKHIRLKTTINDRKAPKRAHSMSKTLFLAFLPVHCPVGLLTFLIYSPRSCSPCLCTACRFQQIMSAKLAFSDL